MNVLAKKILLFQGRQAFQFVNGFGITQLTQKILIFEKHFNFRVIKKFDALRNVCFVRRAFGRKMFQF